LIRRVPLFILLSGILIAFGASAVVASDHGLEKDLRRDLAQTRPIIAKIKAGRQTKTDMERLKGLTENIKAAHLLLDERFKQREQEPGLQGPKAKERHARMRQKYRQAMDEYVTLLEGVAQSRDLKAATLDRLMALLNKLLPKKRRPLYGSLPYRHLRYSAKAPLLTPVITPAYQGGDKAVVPADTAATAEAPISEEIAALAKSLGWSPVAIYEWVKNNIETEWYWGSMKGAEETLRQKSGNACDQATLLVALLRAAGYPCRYVRGVIEFFPDIEVAKNLFGIADERELAAFFQKAGIPYKQVIAGGRIANLQIEHVWVESYIPYANYRGVVIDDQGKTWLGLDTAIKAAGYTYNAPQQIPSEVSLTGVVREDYLSVVQTELPLEYLQAQIQADLPTGSTYADLLSQRQLIPEEMRILPASLQFKEIAITGEYAAMPQELIHQARIQALAPDKTELFSVTLPAFTLTSRPISLTYEPETVEDQEIINSYGGLGNTPSYLIHLRPVLQVDGERVAIGKDGFASGTEYTLNLDLISPSGLEKITNTLIIGNLSVMGFVAQKPSPLGVGGEGTGEGEKDATRLLFEQAISYIERWNQAEAELASLLGLTLSRPLPTVVTLGGVVEITSLLDIPQGFEWKGVYVDANLRAIELATGYGLQATSDAPRIFMQLSALQGSILENRIFEDAFQVESVSTAKLFGLAHVAGVSLVAIDKNNIATLLPTLAVADDVKEAIQNAVNQNLVIRIPNSEISYEDWTGIGFLAENPATGEAGWMLTGEIAGGMTVWNPERWGEWGSSAGDIFQSYTSEPPNKDPLSAYAIDRITATDRQKGTVGKPLPKTLQALVRDKVGKPVKGADVTFTIKAGGGTLQTVEKKTDGTPVAAGSSLQVKTNQSGIAKLILILGKQTGMGCTGDTCPSTCRGLPAGNPTMWWEQGYTYSQQVGENIVDAVLVAGTRAALPSPFAAYGFPDKTSATIRMTRGDGTTGHILSFAGFISVAIEDQYCNPISNQEVTFTVQPASERKPQCSNPSTDTTPAVLVETNDPCLQTSPTHGQCGTQSNSLDEITSSGGAAVEVILGGIPHGDYPIVAASVGLSSTTFHLFTYPRGNCDGDTAPQHSLLLEYVYPADQYGNNINAVQYNPDPEKQAAIPLMGRMYFLREGETTKLDCGETCPKIVGTRTYTVDNQFRTASMTFGGKAGIELEPKGRGFFTYDYKPEKVGLNDVEIHGSATALNNVRVTTVDCSKTPPICETNSIPLTASGTIKMQVYGVNIQVPEKLLILVDESGFAVGDTPIQYTIEPSDYMAATAYVAIIRDGSPMWYIPGKTKGTDTVTLAKGYWFDINGTYTAQVILNYGTGVEIKSEPIPFELIVLKVELVDTVEAIGKNKNFISGETLTIKYKITPDILTESDYRWEILEDQTIRSMKTAPPAGGPIPNIDHANRQFSFIPQHGEGNSPAGTAERTKGLRYRLRFRYKDSYPYEFIIEQDDVNRARQEQKIIHPNETVPAIEQYKGVETRLFKGTTASTCFPDRNMWLDQGIGAIDNSIYNGGYPNVYYSCSWRSPYYNKTISDYFGHPSGKAVDCRPAGENQTAQDYQQQWDVIVTIGTTVLLENGDRITKSNSRGWYPLSKEDADYNPQYPDRTWGYKRPGETIEIGYKLENVSHYHIAVYP